MISVIDYGMGNVGSIVNMLKKIGVAATLAQNCDQIFAAAKIILPGVGAFDAGMKQLHSKGLVDAIYQHVSQRKPLLGICLGMQMLGMDSEEGTMAGLSLIEFHNRKFAFDAKCNLKIPHMGWDVVTNHHNDDPLVASLPDSQRYYFVHSYHAICKNVDDILMSCDYGYSFAAAVKKDKVYGVQFHPEKSHRFGMALLENFAWRV